MSLSPAVFVVAGDDRVGQRRSVAVELLDSPPVPEPAELPLIVQAVR